MSSSRGVSVLLAVLVSCLVEKSGAQTNDVVGVLQATYERHLGILDILAGSNQQALVVWYGQQLQPLREKLKRDEDLDGLKAVKAEIDRFQTNRTLPDDVTATNASLGVLRNELSARVEQMRADFVKRHTTLIRQYLNALTLKKRELIAADKLDDATAVNEEIKRMEALQAVLEGKTSKPPDSVPATGGEAPAPPKPPESSP